MKNYNKAIGKYGESIARDFLINNGYKILNMNYRNRYGEIDIISIKNDIIIFCEVKSRYTNSFGNPIEAVTYYKQKQIIKLKIWSPPDNTVKALFLLKSILSK